MKKDEFEAMKASLYKRNKEIAVKSEKASDLDIIVGSIMQLPYGQLKKVLTEEVMAVLEKYGYKEV